MFLELSVVLSGGSVSGNPRFSVQLASASGEYHCRLTRNLGIPQGGGPGGTVYGRCPNVVAQYIWPNTSRCGGESPVGQSTRKESGWAVGWVASKSGSRISAQTSAAAGSPRWTAWSTPRRPTIDCSRGCPFNLLAPLSMCWGKEPLRVSGVHSRDGPIWVPEIGRVFAIPKRTSRNQASARDSY